MIKFVIFSMVLALALAKPGDNDGNLLGGLTNALPNAAAPSLMNNQCFTSLLSTATLNLTLPNLIDLIECLLDQLLSIVEQVLGGDHAGAQSTLLIKLLQNLRSLLMNTLSTVATLLGKTGGGNNAATTNGITSILSTATKAIQGWGSS